MAILPPPQLEESWKIVLEEEWQKGYLLELAAFLAKERASGVPVYPPKEQVFQAFAYTPLDRVKVVVIGQDPYHGADQAHGLSFSVLPGVRIPPSLRNIYQELHDDLGVPIPNHGCLAGWAKQGVMMLNTVLTVRAGQPRSHYGKGWELFTDAVVQALCKREDPIVFVLWGQAAQEKCRHILAETGNRHFILTSPHPSPYSAHSGFFGCRHFSKISELLTRQGKEPIHWEQL
ncbi:MAG: Uracil-DNA glycosylase [Chlamydiae bacterium]|nr:Uracil-DNA glycosylase [Chlamydiota bacterium]